MNGLSKRFRMVQQKNIMSEPLVEINVQ